MRRSLPLCLILLSLSACNPKPTTIVAGDDSDDMKAQLAKAKPVTLPPSISSSQVYRCEDNGVVYVDWFSDGSASVKTDKAGSPSKLPAAAAGVPLTGSGFTVKGGRADPEITVTTPAHAAQKCTSS